MLDHDNFTRFSPRQEGNLLASSQIYVVTMSSEPMEGKEGLVPSPRLGIMLLSLHHGGCAVLLMGSEALPYKASLQASSLAAQSAGQMGPQASSSPQLCPTESPDS